MNFSTLGQLIAHSKRWSMVILILFLFISSVNAQKLKSPLFEFFQTTADSTIILSHIHIVDEYPDYFIVSKTGDTVNMYTYRFKNLIQPSAKVNVPNAIAKIMTRKNLHLREQTPDFNSLFEVKIVEKETLTKLWQELRKENIWKVNDDLIDGKGCPKIGDENPSEIYDGGGILFKLITRKTVKDLSFYAPSYYEKYCPGRQGRISALKIDAIFKIYFTNAGEKKVGELQKINFMFRNSF